MAEPVPGISAVPDETNARYFHVVVAGKCFCFLNFCIYPWWYFMHFVQISDCSCLLMNNVDPVSVTGTYKLFVDGGRVTLTLKLQPLSADSARGGCGYR